MPKDLHINGQLCYFIAVALYHHYLSENEQKSQIQFCANKRLILYDKIKLTATDTDPWYKDLSS